MRTRKLVLDICDYTNKVLCNLYDNQSDASGQATDVFVTYERNGWKELSFNIPSTCIGEEGQEPNYRMNYLIADYRIRLVDDHETDWYIISESKITHNAFSKNYEIKAGHISQLLKTKALDLEFSSEEGNNVGTAEQLLTTILEGTDWNVGYVEDFLDNDGSVKHRTLEAPAKTGAMKMIQDMCDLFEAKPIFHGDTKTVDIVHMNPFSKVANGEVPKEVKEGRNILELHYDNNIFDLSRTANTENIVTKLYAYGAYGDAVTGMCSIQTCSHNEYRISFANDVPAGTEIKFSTDEATYYFTPPDKIFPATILIWSDLDFTSQSYVWNESRKKAYHVYKTPNSHSWPEYSITKESVQNYFPALFNFNYYDEVGLFTDEMLQEVAKYQRDIGAMYKTSADASEDLNNEQQKLREIAHPGIGFLRLDVASYETDNSDPDHVGLLRLKFKTTDYPEGVIYRSDYLESRRNYFDWYVASELKPNGMPVSGLGSVLYIVHDTTPVTWEKIYVKVIYDNNGNVYTNSEGKPGTFSYKTDEGYPAKITVWKERSKVPVLSSENDRFYLFCTDSMTGSLGTLETNDETVVNNISQSVKEAASDGTTVEHVVLFSDDRYANPSHSVAHTNYGWLYKYSATTINEGTLHLCWGEKGDRYWWRVYIQDDFPNAPEAKEYYINRKGGSMYRYTSGRWVELDTVAERRVANATLVVYQAALERDMLYHGYYEKYRHTQSTDLSSGNYAFKNAYNSYYLFTLTEDVGANQSVVLDTIKGHVWPTDNIDNIVTVTTQPSSTITFPVENEINPDNFSHGTINSTGTFAIHETDYVSNYIRVYDNVSYSYSSYINKTSYVYFYTYRKTFISRTTIFDTGSFTTPADTYYMRICTPEIPSSDHYIRVTDYANKFFVKNKLYTLLSSAGEGELIGINNLMKKFADSADNVYDKLLGDYLSAQAEISNRSNALAVLLGDLLREGWWQDDKYVEGDDKKLYSDAMDNLEEIGQPEYDYSFTFLDLYGANKNQSYGIDENEPAWPDVQISDAAHLIDPELNINKWAYIDKLEKCYDKEWQTKIEVNTNLSLIGQHSFTDVMTRIAEIANETKSKRTIYERAKYFNSAGYLASEKLSGALETARNAILGGASSWYTDDRGRIVFESTDGKYAMMLSGAGLLISNTKDKWGDWQWSTALTGDGLAADAVAAAFISAKEALIGAITTDMISAAVGNELEISSNKALLLYATADGERPAGALKTTDALIEIKAGSDNTPAQINIASGGEINLLAGTQSSGGKLNIDSHGELNLNGGSITMNSGSDLTVGAYADINVTSNGSINVGADGDITIDSNGKLNVSASNIVISSNKSMQDVINEEIVSTTKEYRLSTSSSSATEGNYEWQTTVPYPDPNTYIWGRIHTVNKKGDDTYTDPVLEETLDLFSATRELALDIKDGRQSVPYVESTGITIQGKNLTVSAQAKLNIASNAEMIISNYAGNDMIKMNKDGIIIATSSDLSVAAGNILTIDADRISLNSTSTGSSATITNSVITESIRVYKAGTSNSTAPSISKNATTGLDSSWTVNIPSVTSTNKYLWSVTRIKHGIGGKYDYGVPEYEGILSSITEVIQTQYIRSSSKTTAPSATASGWSEIIPPEDTSKKYIWVCEARLKHDGTVTRTNIHCDETLSDMSTAAVTAANIASGAIGVPHVTTSGLDISNSGVSLTSTTALSIAANEELKITNHQGNDAIILNGNGVSIASNKNVAIAAGGKLQFGTGSRMFTVGGDSTDGWIRYGVESMDDIAHNGIYIGTNGIRLGKGVFNVTNAGAVTATNMTITGGSISITNSSTGNTNFHVNNKGVLTAHSATIDGDITATSFTLASGVTIPTSYVNGLTNAGVAYRYATSTSGTTVPSSGWNTSRPTNVAKGSYVWTEIKTTALNGSISTQYAVEYYAKDGAKGDPGDPGDPGTPGKYVTSIVELYNLHTSKPSKPTASTTINTTDVKKAWTTVVPTYASGYTYYTSSKTTYSDSSVVFADVITNYALTTANANATTASDAATTAANTVEPFTHDGLSYNTTWDNKTYGVTLCNSDDALPMLIGSNSGITIAKSKTSSDGAALAIDSSGIGMYGTTINFITGTGASATNAISLNSSGITISSNATISIQASKKLSLTTVGTIEIGNGVKPFIIGATTGTNGHAYMYNGTSSMTSTADGIYIGTDGIRLGGGNFNVTTEGAITAKSGNVGGWYIGSSYIGDADTLAGSAVGMRFTTNDNNTAFFAGADRLSVSSAKFLVTHGGSIRATAGTIGGWTIGDTQLKSGSSTNTVVLDSGSENQDYAIWVGHGTSTSAPFRVKRNGEVSLTKLMAIGEDQSEQEVNLRTAGLWKLNYRTVKSLTATTSGGQTTLTLGTSNGDLTVNFSNAASVTLTGSWGGSSDPSYTATASNGKSVNSGQVTVQRTNPGGVPAKNVHITVYAGPSRLFDQNIDASDIYGDGESTGFAAVGFKSETLWISGSKTITLDNDKTKTVSIPTPASSDWSAAYVGNKKMSISVNVGGKALTSGAIDDPGYDAGFSDVGFKSTGGWSGGSRTITLDNDEILTVDMPASGTFTKGSQYGSIIQVNFTAGGKTYSGTISV